MIPAPPPDPKSSPKSSPRAAYPRPGRPGSLGEILNAGRGFFDLTPGGFIRSFFAPAIALPFYVFAAGLIARNMAATPTVPTSDLWGAGLAHILDAAAFPALIALLARPLQISQGYGGFIIVTNWASLFLNMILAAASLFAFASADGLEAFKLISLGVLGVWIFIIWRSGRLLLSKEIAPVMLMVVLSVGVGVLADAVSDWVVKAL
jgi:hypothetical protein